MSHLMFFPWFAVREPRSHAGYLLHPWQQGQTLPDGTPPEAVDRILGCYQDAGGNPVHRATLLQKAGGGFLDERVPEEIDDASQFARLLATAGLSGRSVFNQIGYCNADLFGLVIQRFDEFPDWVSPQTRRRDGTTRGMWPTDSYRVVQPQHVHSHLGLYVDWPLLDALATAAVAKGSDDLLDASVMFNMANTDSAATSPSVELVLLAGALQRVLGCKSAEAAETTRAIREAFEPGVEITPSARSTIQEREPARARHSRDSTMREAWIRDLYLLRHNPAHGKITHAYQSAWDENEHLLLGSFVFPLLLKIALQERGFYELCNSDRANLGKFEALAVADLFAGPQDGIFPWSEIMDGG